MHFLFDQVSIVISFRIAADLKMNNGSCRLTTSNPISHTQTNSLPLSKNSRFTKTVDREWVIPNSFTQYLFVISGLNIFWIVFLVVSNSGRKGILLAWTNVIWTNIKELIKETEGHKIYRTVQRFPRLRSWCWFVYLGLSRRARRIFFWPERISEINIKC